jgi:hypothetical protein
MTSDRKKPGVAFWATVVLVVALGAYPLSWGPACWVSSRLDAGCSCLPLVYRPMIWAMARNDRVAAALNRYAELGAAPNWYWLDISEPEINPYDFVWMHFQVEWCSYGSAPSP